MIYIHAAAIHNTLPAGAAPDLKAELKLLTGKSYRRIDRFIQLAIIGAHKAAAGCDLDAETAIYLTSGQGDIPVFMRVRRQRCFQGMMSKPVDFVNLSGNAAGFYVASHLGLAGTSLFLSHKDFPVQMALLLAQSDLNLRRQSAVLLGGVDEWCEDQDLAKKLLGVEAATRLGEGSNWLLLRPEAAGARAALEVDPRQFDVLQVKDEISRLEPGTYLAFSQRLPEPLTAQLSALRGDLPRFNYEASCAVYETLPLYVFNLFQLERPAASGCLFHVDGDGECFMTTKLQLLAQV